MHIPAPLCTACIVAGAVFGLLWWVPMLHLNIPWWACVLTGTGAAILALGAWVFA